MKYFFRDQQTLSKFQLHPLGKYMNSYAKHLRGQGYDRETGRLKIRMIAHFCLWLKQQGIAAKGLTEKHIQKYLRAKVRVGRHLTHEDTVAIQQFMVFLRNKGAIAEQPIPPVQATPVEKMVDDYALYLKRERALSLGTIAQYRRHVSRFLTDDFAEVEHGLSTLDSVSILSYVRSKAARVSRKDAKLMITALRSFLRYAHYQGYIHADLEAAVPAVANWNTVSIPKSLPPDQVERVLAACDRKTAIGKRDYAILLLLARLGLRAGEIVSLRLEDIDWGSGCISIHGKGSNLSQMPLPVDVGEAVALYLRRGRPKSSSRVAFLRSQAPITGLAGAGTVSGRVAAALERAGINAVRKGAHQFRHSLATQLLQKGASLPEIAELLRHRSLDCTTIYAKVDLSSLRTLGMAWPGGAQ